MVRLIDDRGRLFGKINVVDILVLLVIVALAVFVALRGSGEGATPETVPVKITFVIQPTDPRMLDAYTALGPLTDMSGRAIGTIENAEVSQLAPVQFGGKGWEFGLTYPVAPDVVFVVSGQGYVVGETVHVGPLAARVGANIQLVGPGWEGYAQIVRVDRGAAATE